jgi:HSP20 family molecular chaperone IbpA
MRGPGGAHQAGASEEPTGGGVIYRALTDIVETDAGVTLMLDMPGVGPDQVDVTLEHRVLTIRGRLSSARPETLDLAYEEYGEGDYERAFTLSEDFDPDRIEAEMRGAARKAATTAGASP